jgi:integrase
MSERCRGGKGTLELLTPSGQPFVNNAAKHGFKRLLKTAGLPDMRFHDPRHTAATLPLSRGVHPQVVSEMLGHADIAITLRVYAHVTPMGRPTWRR